MLRLLSFDVSSLHMLQVALFVEEMCVVSPDVSTVSIQMFLACRGVQVFCNHVLFNFLYCVKAHARMLCCIYMYMYLCILAVARAATAAH